MSGRNRGSFRGRGRGLVVGETVGPAIGDTAGLFEGETVGPNFEVEPGASYDEMDVDIGASTFLLNK